MKKTLVALAALACTGAFAQVTVNGYIDRAYTVVDNTNDLKDSKGLASSAGTTALIINGAQDLGNGIKGAFVITTEWADVGGQTQDGAATATGGANQVGTFANAQSYIELSGNFGTVRAGTINNEVLSAVVSVGSPSFSTGIGSAYSTGFSIHNGYGTGTTGFSGIVTTSAIGGTGVGARGIRQANTIKYISPTFNGFKVAYGIAPKNDDGGAGTADTVGATDLSLTYANGPLTVMYAMLKYEVGSAGSLAAGALTAGTDNTHSILAANYKITPAWTVYAGLGSSKGISVAGVDTADTSSTQVGVSYALSPTISLMAQVVSVDDKAAATNADRTLTGLGANYQFTPAARLYFRYDKANYNTNVTASGSEQTRTAFGLSYTF